LAACLLALAGCGGDESRGPGPGGDDHAGHVIPAHKPKTFPDAVRRLRELNDEFGREFDATTRKSADEKTLRIAVDIAKWLPEIAADSDMPEKPWDEVNARSRALVADFEALVSGSTRDARGLVKHAGVEIEALERLLVASDPSWFRGTEKTAAAH
jgi:hypothetical protein